MKYTTEEMLASQSDGKGRGPVLKANLTGKVVIVTGANTGLGFEAAKHFATMNPARLILACRNQAKGQAALKTLTDDTKFSRAEVWLLDVSNFVSVKSFADKATKELDRIDFLIENASMMTYRYETTPEGWETTIQTNALGPELLAFLLIPKLLATAKNFSTLPRLVVVASAVHYWARFTEDIIKSPSMHQRFSEREFCKPGSECCGLGLCRYSVSKLLNVAFARALASRVPKTDPTFIVNVLDPGFCISEFRREANRDNRPKEAAMFEALEKQIAYTTEEGSRHLVYPALVGLGNRAEEGKLNGAYMASSQLTEVSDLLLDDLGKYAQEKLWAETVEILGGVDGRIREIVQNL